MQIQGCIKYNGVFTNWGSMNITKLVSTRNFDCYLLRHKNNSMYCDSSGLYKYEKNGNSTMQIVI